jgi:hypothetical protein
MLVLYALVGVACAVAVLRRSSGPHEKAGMGAFWSAVATVPLWPLWAPFVLATPRPRDRPVTAADAGEGRTAVHATATHEGETSRAARARIRRALDESVKAVAGTEVAPLFSRHVADRIAEEVGRVAQRIDELLGLTSSAGLDRAAAEQRLRALETEAGASDRAVATARLQLESLMRLEALRASDARALDELADLLEALRAQLLLARYAGSAADGTSAIVSEVWARLEGLGAGFEPSAHGHSPPSQPLRGSAAVPSGGGL